MKHLNLELSKALQEAAELAGVELNSELLYCYYAEDQKSPFMLEKGSVEDEKLNFPFTTPALDLNELGKVLLGLNDGSWNVSDTLISCWLEEDETRARGEAIIAVLTERASQKA